MEENSGILVSLSSCPQTVDQGTVVYMTVNAITGTPPFTFFLVKDGSIVSTPYQGSLTDTSYTFSYQVNEAIGSYNFGGYIVDSCPTGPLASTVDICTIQVVVPTPPPTPSPSPTPSPTIMPPTPTPTEIPIITPTPPISTPTPTPAIDICSWILSNGGIHPMPVANISTLVAGYLGFLNPPLEFTVMASYISGAVAYYLGYIDSGNSLTGCMLS